ncbi:MAG: glycosyltransferase family 2 protein [Firmicutes bacterium]|nr:glycosyltransferase family 2 protein [Bacillota bacterium]
MKTTIIIVNYNSLPAFRACLDSLLLNTSPPLEIIVIDNHSEDGSVAYLQTINLPVVQIIYNQTNLGFTKACNQGIQRAQGEQLVTMNPDVIVSKGWLDRMAWHLRNNPRTLIVGPKGLGIGGRQAPGLLCYPSKLTAADRKFATVYRRQSEPTKFLIGCLILFDRRLIEKIGFFDEKMPLGADDFDLSLRVRQAGYQLRVARDVLIKHLVHVSFKRSDPEVCRKLAELSYRHFNRKWATELDRYGWQRLFEDEEPVYPGDPL